MGIALVPPRCAAATNAGTVILSVSFTDGNRPVAASLRHRSPTDTGSRCGIIRRRGYCNLALVHWGGRELNPGGGGGGVKIKTEKKFTV